MLIKALCDYYDILEKDGKTVQEGYSKVDVDYKIMLNLKGEIEDIICIRREEEQQDKNVKIKLKSFPETVIMNKRVDFPGIKANLIEHRALYIFGLNYNKKEKNFYVGNENDKAYKAHIEFARSNLEFIEGIDSDIVNAYRNFIKNWKPEAEINNKFLMNIGGQYDSAKFIFALAGNPGILLHEDKKIKEKNESLLCKKKENEDMKQCSITGEKAEISRLHGVIKGIIGGQASRHKISVL